MTPRRTFFEAGLALEAGLAFEAGFAAFDAGFAFVVVFDLGFVAAVLAAA